MTDDYDRRSSARLRARLEAARTAGAWMPWLGLLTALLLWGGAGLWLYANFGLETLLSQPLPAIIGAVTAILAPGVALIAAGIMARESRRSSEANALVMSAARLLLEPAEHVRGEITTIATDVADESERVNDALADARDRMEGLKQDIEASVTSALKAAEIVRADSEVLVSRMSGERQSLAELSAQVREQTDMLAKTIPMHAQLLAEAGRKAQEDVRKADGSLQQRLNELEETARRLAERVQQIDSMGAESRKRAQNLASALMRLDEQLVQSTRMVDAAMRAGELATAASKNTADSLRDAMSDALDGALKASEAITERAAAAAADAQDAMLKLREVGVEVETTTRTAAMAAKAHAEETRRDITGHRTAAQPAPSVQMTLPEAPRAEIERQPAERLQIEDTFDLERKIGQTMGDQRPIMRAKPTASADPDVGPSDKLGLSWRDLLTGIDEVVEPQDGDRSNSVIERLDRAGVRLSAVKASDLRRIATAAHMGEHQRRRAIRDLAPSEIQRVTRLLDGDRELQIAAQTFVAVEEPEALRVLATPDHIREDADPRLSAYLFLDAALEAAG